MFKEIKASKTSLSGRKPIYGVGINDADYIVDWNKEDGKRVACPYYSVWRGMLTRCYSKKCMIDNPTYNDCSICEEWLTFTNFKRWMMTQRWEGKAIDKDIVKQGNKEYRPDNCSFVPSRINNLIVGRSRGNKSLPVGVSYEKVKRKYEACLSKDSKKVFLGYFKTPEEARSVYVKAKLKYIKEVAISYYYSGQISRPVFDGLLAWEIK